MVIKTKKSRTGRWIKVKIGGGWRKVSAPALEEKMKMSLLVMKSILKLFDFKVEVRDDKTVPKQLYDLGINDPNLALPTKSLLAHSSSMYPGRSIRCVYYGDTWFWVISDYEDAMGIFLTQEVARLYTATITEYLQTRDISTVEKRFKEYYGISKLEETAPQKLEEIRVSEKERKMVIAKPEQEETKKVHVPLKPTTPLKQEKTEISALPKKAEKPRSKTQEVIPTPTQPLPPMDEVRKAVGGYNPKDAFGRMAKIRFEALLSSLINEELKEELYYAFFPVAKGPQQNDYTNFYLKASLIQQKQESLLQERWKKRTQACAST